MRSRICTICTLAILLLAAGSAVDLNAQDLWHENRLLLPTYLALSGADAWKTEQDQTMPKHHEQNPLIPLSTRGRALYFAGTTATVIGVSWWAERRGHPKLAKRVVQIASTVEIYANCRSWSQK
jgi:hypothetical protein